MEMIDRYTQKGVGFKEYKAAPDRVNEEKDNYQSIPWQIFEGRKVLSYRGFYFAANTSGLIQAFETLENALTSRNPLVTIGQMYPTKQEQDGRFIGEVRKKLNALEGSVESLNNEYEKTKNALANAKDTLSKMPTEFKRTAEQEKMLEELSDLEYIMSKNCMTGQEASVALKVRYDKLSKKVPSYDWAGKTDYGENKQPTMSEEEFLKSRGNAGNLREAAASIPFGEYERWNKNLDNYQGGKLRLDKPFVVLNRTPEILLKAIELAGDVEMSTQKPIEMRVENLDKITNENIYSENGKHGVSIDELRKLQLELDNPIAVFASQTRPDTSVVVLTELVDASNNSKAIIALQYAYHPNGNYMELKPIKANRINSIYGRGEGETFESFKPLYINTTKVGSSAGSSRLQLPLNLVPRKSPINVTYLTEKNFSMSDKGMILKGGKLFNPENLPGNTR